MIFLGRQVQGSWTWCTRIVQGVSLQQEKESLHTYCTTSYCKTNFKWYRFQMVLFDMCSSLVVSNLVFCLFCRPKWKTSYLHQRKVNKPTLWLVLY
jgi:hypothetical protein